MFLFYTRCDVYHIDLKLAQMIKARWKDIYVVCGGPQSDITSEETMHEIPFVDFICCGEGEKTICQFFASLLHNEPDLTIPGLVHRTEGGVCKNPRPKLIEDLDELPIRDYSLIQHAGKTAQRRERFPVEVGRGCPFGCTFCSTNSFWGRKYRLKSPERIYQEIKVIHERFGITKYSFTHDMFTLNRKKVIETCSLLKTLDFPIDWGGSSRVDCLDKELIDVMVDAGMTGLFLGIETGSPRMQKLINKNLNLDNTVEIVRYMKEKNLFVKASFIYGFPEETEEDISLTIDLMAKLIDLHCVVIPHLCAFFAGTELSNRYSSELVPVDYYSNQTGALAVEECKDLIQAHPKLFLQLMEYKTELRSKLRYFELFVKMWHFAQPIYQYISEKYPPEKMIDMYYDFVASNQETLEKLREYPEEQWFSMFYDKDGFICRFSEDPNYDLLSEVYRFLVTAQLEAVQSGEYVSDIFGIDPRQIRKMPLQNYSRCLANVEWRDRKRTVTIYQNL